MPDTNIIFGFRSSVGVVELDCTVSEQHISESKITDFPVENQVGGSNSISDHIRKTPDTIELEGLVTNTPLIYLLPSTIRYDKYNLKNPITALDSIVSYSPLNNDLHSPINRVEAAYAELSRVQREGELVTVVTSLRDYNNMALSKMTVNRDKDTGNVLSCKMTLTEIIKVQTQTIALPEPVVVSNKKLTQRGHVASVEATPKQDGILHSLTTAIGNAFK